MPNNFVPSAAANTVPAATDNCGVFVTSATHRTYGDLKIIPLHGQAFYANFRVGVDAAYMGYRIENNSTSAISNLWLEVTNFQGAIRLANLADSIQSIGTIPAKSGSTPGSKVVFFLVKATEYSETSSKHDVRIHKEYPTGLSSLYPASGTKANCFYNFQKVVRTLSASANKVTSIEVVGTPTLGSTLTVIVKGLTGQGGSGSLPDGRVMWISPASNSSWPTRAVRLEQTQVVITKPSINETNELLIPFNNSNLKFTSRTSYTATYTFRIIGSTSVDPIIKPLSHISSGTQIKFTGKYPSTQTTLNTSNIVVPITGLKSVVNLASSPTTTDAGISYYEVTYRIVFSTDASSTFTIDQVVDDPGAGAKYVANSLRVTEDTTAKTSLLSPTIEGTSSDVKITFVGPFTGRNVQLSYRMLLPRDPGGTFTNIAYGLIGSRIVGASTTSTDVSGQSVTTSTTDITSDTITQGAPKQDQIIDFPPLPVGSVGGLGTPSAIATSGLPVNYVSLSPAICEIIDVLVEYRATGICNLEARQPGDSTNWNAAPPVTQDVVVRAGQLINFEPNPRMTTSSTQVVSGTATSSLDVTIISLTPDICNNPTKSGSQFTISSKTVTGQCVLLATQGGNDVFGPAQEVERSIFIGANQYLRFTTTLSDTEVTPSTGTITAQTFASTSDSATPLANLPISFLSETPSVCTITSETFSTPTSTANISWSGIGLCLIKASQDGFTDNDVESLYSPADDITTSFSIGRVPVVTVTTNLSEIEAGNSVIATVSVRAPSTSNPTPTGNVILYVGGHVIAADATKTGTLTEQSNTTKNATATFTVTSRILSFFSSRESMTFSASYAANDSYGSAASTQDVVVLVNPPTNQPSVTTSQATSVTTSDATIGGVINPRGYTVDIYMVYGTNSNLTGSPTVDVAIPAGGSGTLNISASVSISGLVPATLYFHRARAAESTDVSPLVVNGNIQSFVTKPLAPGQSTLSMSDELQVTFAPVNFDPATVTITYKVVCTSNLGVVLTVSSSVGIADGSNRVITVPGAVLNSTYTCVVSAISSAPGAAGGGEGAQSQASLPYVVEDAPFAVTDAPTDITATGFRPKGKAHPKSKGSSTPYIKIGLSPTSLDVKITYDAVSENQLNVITTDVLTSINGQPIKPATIYYYRAGITTAASGDADASKVESVLTKPAAPTTVDVVVDKTTATVSFTYDPDKRGDGVALEFTVVCTPTVATGGGSAITVSGPSSPIIITGLAENRLYTCTVTANASATGVTNGGGNGDSRSANMENRIYAITDAPDDLITDSSVIIRGKVNNRGKAGGAGLFEFAETSDLSGPTKGLSSELPYTSDVLVPLASATLTGLKPATIYYYQALAKATGQSDAAGDVKAVATKAPKPTSVTIDEVDSTTLRINFNAPNAGPNVTLVFTVTCTSDAGGDPITATGSGSPISVTGLTPGTSYTCLVVGEATPTSNQVFGGGRGENSQAATRATPATAPGGGGTGGGGTGGGGTGGGGTDDEANTPGPNVPVVPNNPIPRRDVSGTTVRTRGNTPRSEPVPGLLQNDPSRLPPAAQNITANKATLDIRDGNVIVTPLNGWTGKMSVPVITNIDGEDREVIIEVIVEPELPESGKTTLNKDATTLISWERSPSQVVRYEVDLNGKNVCTTTATSCSIPRLIGPKSDVKVTTVGNDEVKTTELKLPYTPPAQRVQALTVFFAENKAVVTPQARKDLNKIARILKREGFADLKLFGHTDGQSGARNAINLSTQRANTVQNFLLKKLGVEASRVSVAKTPVGEKKPAASNTTKAGQAKNRRTELWLR